MGTSLREDALAYGIAKLDDTAHRLAAFPHTTDHGRWRQSEHGRWTAGFWVGSLWLAYLTTREATWASKATDWAHRLEPRQHDRTTHDMGFLFQPSFVRGWKITHEPHFRDVALTACAAHASRFHPAGSFIPAWDPSEDPRFAGLSIVDTVMNLPILFWGAQVAGRPEWEQIGRAAAATIRTHHLRPDGSSIHVIDFDPVTGKVVGATTHQGYSPESCWTRGQAWALFGFTQVYGWSRDPLDLDAAQQLADYFLAHLPADGVPYWDAQAPDIPHAPRDSAAGAIAASGLLELARTLEGESGARYRQAGLQILDGLTGQCLSRGAPDQDGILLHATVDLPHQSAIDELTIYGDHYFLEALCKALRPDQWPLL